MSIPSLPIIQSLDQLRATLCSGSAVLSSPPGSGKTTVVPLALLAEPWLRGKKIIILQPRRIAARAACYRMASILKESAGETVGYHIRHDKIGGPTTRVEVVTEGILTRRLQQNPELPDVGLIIFDEFHERSIHADLALALSLDICQINDDLRLLVMSATLDVEPISKLLGDVPVITGHGKMYDVQIEYSASAQNQWLSKQVASAIHKVVRERDGDILVFLPGAYDISATASLLRSNPELAGVKIQPLYGQLSQKEQDQIVSPKSTDKRRVVLATDIAETSLTIDGIYNVVDSGWCKRPLYNPTNGLTTLTKMRIAKSSADQRAGRAGRLGPGYCLRLWDQNIHHSLPDFHTPELLQSDLSNLTLELLMWGVQSPDELPWLTPPRKTSYDASLTLLHRLGAVDNANRVTSIGKKMAAYSMHPRLGRLMVEAVRHNQVQLGADICALLSERDIIDGKTSPSAEFSLRLEALTQFREKTRTKKPQHGRPDLCKRVNKTAKSFLASSDPSTDKHRKISVSSLLFTAYPDRLAQKLPGNFGRYKLAGGRTVSLRSNDPLNHCEYLIAAVADGGLKEGRILLAEPIDISTVTSEHPQALTKKDQVLWDNNIGRVRATCQKCVGNIVIAERKKKDVDATLLQKAVRTGIENLGLATLLAQPKTVQLQSRIQLLLKLQPTTPWPDVTTEVLTGDLSWLDPYLIGVHNSAQLKQLNYYEIIRAFLDYPLQRKLDHDAPTHFKVPTGSLLPIDYTHGEPVLAVRLQELFGLTTTPSICGGKISLVLHLLSPAQRPIQITTDLPGFWKNSYFDVKKDLSGRYPKHYWPDNPLEATATKYTKKRMQGKK